MSEEMGGWVSEGEVGQYGGGCVSEGVCVDGGGGRINRQAGRQAGRQATELYMSHNVPYSHTRSCTCIHVCY